MSNGKQEDIGVRIVTDYQQALKDIQAFTGTAGKELSGLPKIVQQIGTSVDALAAQIGKLSQTNGPRSLQQDLTALPPVVERLAKAANQAADNLEKIGQKGRRGLREANDDASRLSRTLDKLVTGGKAVGAAFAGFQAGKMVLAPVVNTTMDYGMRLADSVNVAVPGASMADKTKVMKEINAGLERARQAGGGKREDIEAAAAALFARNSLGDYKETLAVMPGITKTAKAGGASVQDIAQATSGLILSLGVASKDNELALARLLYAGQIGGAELKNMAHSLPSQAAAAKNAGLSGLPAVAKIGALNELSVNYSGTADQAGINTNDFLNSMNSAHLAMNLKRFSFDKKTNALVFNAGKRMGKNYLNLGDQLAENAAHGIDAIDTMIQITGMVVKGNPNYAKAVKKRDAAQQRLDAAKKMGDKPGQVEAQQELADTAESVVKILEGSGIGKLFHNQQELRGGIGVLTNPDAYHSMVRDIVEKGTIDNRDNALDFLKVQPGFKAEMYEQDKAAAVYTGMEGFNKTLGTLADKASALYQKYPEFAALLEGGKVGVVTLGASAGSAAIVMSLLTKNAAKASLALGGIGGKTGADTIPGVPKSAGGFGRNAMHGLKIGGPLNAAFAAYDAYGIYNNDTLTPEQKKVGYTGAVGGAVGGTVGGAVAGAALGSVVPGFGTVIGGVIGAGLGYWGGDKVGTMAGEAMFGDNTDTKVAKALEQSIKSNPIEAKLQLKISYDDLGRPVVSQTNLSGTNFRLDTGPMLTH